MNKRRSPFAPALSVVDSILESRVVLSGVALQQSAAEVAGHSARKVATETTVTVSAGTLGQPITYTVTVRGPAAAGSPQGTVNLVDHGTVLQTLTLSPTTSTSARSASSSATYTLTPQPGGSAYWFGKHSVTADFIPSGRFLKSSANKNYTVSQPDYATLAANVQIATIVPGTGAQIQSGQTANVLYTGYLAKNGQIFDDSADHGGTPISFTVGAGQVIPGFDEGVAGMRVGETRIISIPAAEGYGSATTGSIPANSNLLFVVTLQSIS